MLPRTLFAPTGRCVQRRRRFTPDGCRHCCSAAVKAQAVSIGCRNARAGRQSGAGCAGGGLGMRAPGGVSRLLPPDCGQRSSFLG